MLINAPTSAVREINLYTLVNPLEQISRDITQMYQFRRIRMIEITVIHTPHFIVRGRGSGEDDVDRHDDGEEL